MELLSSNNYLGGEKSNKLNPLSIGKTERFPWQPIKYINKEDEINKDCLKWESFLDAVWLEYEELLKEYNNLTNRNIDIPKKPEWLLK